MMRRKIVAVALAVAVMVGTMAGFASANIHDQNTEAGIEFNDSSIAPQIPAHNIPDLPAGVQPINDLSFHTHYIAIDDQVYQSWNASGLQSSIGLPVLSSYNFTVTVELGDFFIDGNTANPTLEGARLDLMAGGATIGAGGHVWQSWDSRNDAQVALLAGSNRLTAGSGTPITVAQGTNFTQGVPLLWAANLVGELLVDAGTADPGEAQAEMVWSIVSNGNG